jgi:hypothetical protein
MCIQQAALPFDFLKNTGCQFFNKPVELEFFRIALFFHKGFLCFA